jgi:hypothetical protein
MRTAMPCQVVRPEPDILCAPSTNPTGFIYSSYSTAHIGPHRQKPREIRLL